MRRDHVFLILSSTFAFKFQDLCYSLSVLKKVFICVVCDDMTVLFLVFIHFLLLIVFTYSSFVLALLSRYYCHSFLCLRIFLLRLFNFNNINPAAPQRIIATIFCCMNHATPPNAAKIIPNTPIPCLYLINIFRKAF